MNSKLSLILLGALVTLAVLSAAENPGESSLSEEVASSRLARAADADPGKSKKKSKRNKKASKKSKSKRMSKKTSKKGKSKRNNKKASKKGKSKRNNKKASRKDKSKNKSRKASKSKRKSKKNSKKGKSERKNNKRNQKKAGKRTNKVREGRSTVPDTCISTAVNALYNGFSKKATNFDRQQKRIETRLPKIVSKRGKMTEYNQTLDDLVAANSSCPAGNQTEIDALVATLGECETQISTACAIPMINQTQIDECKPMVEDFQAEVLECFELNDDAAAACECWESDDMAELEESLKGCVIKESETNVTDAFKECKKAVSTCNKVQTEAIPVLVACSKTESDLVAEAETVANNIVALGEAKAAVEAAAASRRQRAAATNCTEFIALVDAREFSAQSLYL